MRFILPKNDGAQRYLEGQLRWEWLSLPHGEHTEALASLLSPRDEEGIDLNAPPMALQVQVQISLIQEAKT